MNAKPPETFGLDRLQTPIGPALPVTDAQGALLAVARDRRRDALRHRNDLAVDHEHVAGLEAC